MSRWSYTIAGLIVGALTLLAGLVGVFARSNRFYAQSEIAIVNIGRFTNENDLVVAASTFARAYNDDVLVADDLRAAGFEPDDIARVAVSGSVVGGSAAIRITVASSDPVLAELVAGALAVKAPNVTPLNQLYETDVLSSAIGTAHRRSGETGALVFLASMIALCAGVVTSVIWRRIPAGSPDVRQEPRSWRRWTSLHR